jgi:hypothetical protein
MSRGRARAAIGGGSKALGLRREARWHGGGGAAQRPVCEYKFSSFTCRRLGMCCDSVRRQRLARVGYQRGLARRNRRGGDSPSQAGTVVTDSHRQCCPSPTATRCYDSQSETEAAKLEAQHRVRELEAQLVQYCHCIARTRRGAAYRRMIDATCGCTRRRETKLPDLGSLLKNAVIVLVAEPAP